MISKKLKKLNRRELVDVIYQLKTNEEEMQAKIATLEEELQDKRIHLSVAGSIAEAATDITNIFSTAQETADLYLHEISCMKEDTAKECEKMIEDAKKQVDEIMAEGKKQYNILAAAYKRDYSKWQQLQASVQRLENQDNKE